MLMHPPKADQSKLHKPSGTIPRSRSLCKSKHDGLFPTKTNLHMQPIQNCRRQLTFPRTHDFWCVAFRGCVWHPVCGGQELSAPESTTHLKSMILRQSKFCASGCVVVFGCVLFSSEFKDGCMKQTQLVQRTFLGDLSSVIEKLRVGVATRACLLHTSRRFKC